MKKAIIFGANELAEQLFLSNVENGEQYEIVAFTVDKEFLNTDNLHGVPIIPYDVLHKFYSPQEVEGLFLCLGYKNMNLNRMNIYKRLIDENKYHILNYIDSRASVHTECIGLGNIFFSGAYIGFKCIVGNGNIFSHNCIIGHDSNIGNFNFFSVGSSTGGKVFIRDRCFFGMRSAAAHGIIIENRTLLGAGGYISSNSEEGSTYSPEQMRKVVLSQEYQNLILK